MANLYDYIAWRGDLTFEQSPFNEVDNLILAQLSYIDLKGIVPGTGEKNEILLRDAARLFFGLHPETELSQDRSSAAKTPLMLRDMAVSRRFRNAVLSKFTEKFDPEKEMQFAALHITLDDGSTYVSFRGTDDTLVGWREDFNMAVATVPSQLEAVSYLERTCRSSRRKYRVGGHSKGGNLAVYAATQCSSSIRRKIIAVYNNDGPGFHKEILHSQGFLEMTPFIRVYQPFASMIGMLLNQRGRRVIVSSTQIGLMQHDAMSWQIVGTHFVYEKSFTDGSLAFRKDMRNWLNRYSQDEVSKLISDLFMVMKATGANNLSEVTEYGIHNLKATMKTIVGLSRDARKGILDFFRILIVARAADEARAHGINVPRAEAE